eukprot:CAMPEP_0178943572 /NCGR_PEP_ID=MMETSP0789-20121207/2661_1 /TAXON_ID=3005 /ORGANISM="Rhizosolenia setigera, Strain CCMP 1694" /LENGTH=280 /DNA_ID=CAMNT_0020623181 /DNA_START=11 /DNA_END=853 /DNA_ORIENTATION=-
MTRNKSRPKMKKLRKLGFDMVEADLQRPSTLKNIGKGCNGCYIHATGGDTAELDTTEVSSAQNLCDALHHDVKSVVYNSSAGEKDHGVKRIQQKHDIEKILEKRLKPCCGVTSLRANLFGEELWKVYTRPQILKGKYPLTVNFWRKIYLTNVRDMGRLAGTIVRAQSQEDGPISSTSIDIINVAGDHMSGPQIAKAFGRAQGSKCKYVHNKELIKYAKKSFPDLYEIIRFLQRSKEKTNIKALKKRFPGLITSFSDFLEETHWGDKQRTYADFSDPKLLL